MKESLTDVHRIAGRGRRPLVPDDGDEGVDVDDSGDMITATAHPLRHAPILELAYNFRSFLRVE